MTLRRLAALTAEMPKPVRVLSTEEDTGSTSVTSATFSVDLGTASEKTLVCVVPACNTASSTNLTATLTVGGEAMTKVAEGLSGDRCVSIHAWKGTLTGAQDVAITYVGTGSCRHAVLYSAVLLHAQSATPTDTDNNNSLPNVTVPENGIGIFAGTDLSGSENSTPPTGMVLIGSTPDTNQQNSVAAYDDTAGSQTATWVYGQSTGCAAAFR